MDNNKSYLRNKYLLNYWWGTIVVIAMGILLIIFSDILKLDNYLHGKSVPFICIGTIVFVCIDVFDFATLHISNMHVLSIVISKQSVNIWYISPFNQVKHIATMKEELTIEMEENEVPFTLKKSILLLFKKKDATILRLTNSEFWRPEEIINLHDSLSKKTN